MIHNLKGACCDHCAETGGSCGGHPGSAAPRMGWALSPIPRIYSRRALGTLNCDADGNCYDTSTGTYTTPASGGLTLAQVQAGATVGSCAYGTDANGNCLPGTMPLAPPSSTFSTLGSWLTSNSTALVALAALVGIAATFGGGRRR
jgi:hypothetical protein